MEEVLIQPPAAEAPLEDEAIWRAHVTDFLKFKGSARDYCRENGLNHPLFRLYKRKFGLTKPHGRRQKAFVKVESPVDPGLSFPQCISQKSRLPDPKWVAEVLARLLALS